jgi:heme exporter protein A
MKQRLKYTFALLHKPELLILDEPRSNLDAEGISIVYEIIKEQKQKGATLIATNDSEDLRFCENVINLDDQKHNTNRH